jgi:hypothetical protein
MTVEELREIGTSTGTTSPRPRLSADCAGHDATQTGTLHWLWSSVQEG